MIAQITTIGRNNHIPSRIKIIQPSQTQSNQGTKQTNSTVPYFERDNFLKEEAHPKEITALHNLGLVKITEEDLIETKTALNIIGYDPTIKLINLITEYDVLAIARTEHNSHIHLKFLAALLPKLKKEARATHLALCLPRALQKLLDVFVVTGEFVPNLSPINLDDYGLKGENDFVTLLKAARLAGYQLVAVAPDKPAAVFDLEYEQKMALRILTILKVEEKAKVIFLSPDKHLSYVPVGDWIPATGILKNEGVKIFTVNQLWHSDFMPKVLASFLRGLTRPMAIASKDVKMFAALQSRTLPIEYILPTNWDLTIIYPRSTYNPSKFRHNLVEMRAALARAFFFPK